MALRHDDARWEAQFAHEHSRLLGVLPSLIEGGIVEHLEHIGATSVPGALARPCVDIGLAIWPFHLPTRSQAAVEALRYTAVPGYEGPPEQRFRHASGAFQLFIVEAGSERWTDYIILRDYLRHVARARETYSLAKRTLTATVDQEPARYEERMAHLLRETLAEARPWWVDFHGLAPVREVVEELKDLQRPWCISSGWALDLFLGRATRVHQDVDVVIARDDQLILQQHMTARGWTLLAPRDDRLEPWPVHMRLELPRHQVHALRPGRFIDILLTDIACDVWYYRRNPQIIRAAERMLVRTADGVPFLAPELVLLYKSKNTSGRERRNDQADFERVRDQLEPERRAWLRWALVVEDPDHPWIAALE